MQGPARSLCGAVRRLTSPDIDCAQVGLRERDDNLLRVRSSLEPEGPWLAMHFAEILLDEEGMDSNCAVLVRTAAGWFGHTLDGMLCANSGSVRVHVGAELSLLPIGPDGAKRLLIDISDDSSHSVDGEESHREQLICGEHEGLVACHWMRTAESFVAGDPELVIHDRLPPDDWAAEITFLPVDRMRVGEHTPREHAQHKPPSPGLYDLRFGVGASLTTDR